jgi:Cof subfamily protein (haloacid dehalogenase superfamily)
MMDKKIIFFDIDGTIYNREIGISAKTRQAIKLLRQNGHLTFIATGRPMSMGVKEFAEIGFDGVNAACGTYIICQDKVMLNQELSQNIVRQTIDVFEKNNIDAIFEGEKNIYYNSKLEKSEFLTRLDQFKLLTWEYNHIVANKLSIKVNDRQAFGRTLDVVNQYYDIIDRATNFVELVPKGYSKATGIRYIIEHLGIKWENTYAFGDSENDLDMLKYVNHSVAMGNSEEGIKDIARYTTDTIDNDGVYLGLKKLNLI